MNFPDSIEQYLRMNGIEKDNLFFLNTTVDGIITNVGNVLEISVLTPVVGEKVLLFLPVFEGMFPIQANIYLPNIQIFHQQYYNIHLIIDHKTVWILMVDVSEKVLRLQSINDPYAANSPLQISLLEALKFLVLKQKENKIFDLVSQYPDWIKELVHSYEDTIDLEELFPFLSFFTEQSNQLPISHSGVWTQTTQQGNEIHLNAWVIHQHQECFLLIQQVNADADNQQNVIQLARENTLAYEQLKKTKEQLQDLVKLKDQFVSIVSHDLRSPISTLTDGVSFLLEDLDASKPFDNSHREIIEQVREELIRLLNYNNKLYNWTKLNLDAIEVNITDVSLDLLIANLNGQYDGRLNDKRLKMELNITEHVELKTDYVLFNQAISNLIDNAIKFSEAGGKIKIEVEKNRMRIIDQGTGMSKEKIEDIKKGHSLSSSKGTKGEAGTGLGLSIVTRILKTLNFNLEIQSEIGAGTTFTISF